MFKRILLYIVLILSLLYLTRYVVHLGLRESKSGIFKKFSVMFLENNDYENIFIGSSRAECHFNPLIFDSITGFNSFNIGVSGSNNAFTFAILKSYLANSKPPRQIIFNLDFHFAHESSDTIYEFPRFFPYLSNDVLYKELNKIDSRFTLFKYFPFISLPQMNDKYLNWSLRGWLNQSSAYDRSGQKGNLKIIPLEYKNIDSIKQAPYKAYILQENLDYLDSIINLSHQINATLIAVISPTYKEGLLKITNYKEHLEKFSKFLKSRRVFLFDYSEDEMCVQKKFFADYYHMKGIGCDTFSLKFALDFKKNVLQNQDK